MIGAYVDFGKATDSIKILLAYGTNLEINLIVIRDKW